MAAKWRAWFAPGTPVRSADASPGLTTQSEYSNRANQGRRPMDIPLIEQIKIQAHALVPLVKTLQAELGEERANTLVRKALGDVYRSYGERWWRSQGARSFDE